MARLLQGFLQRNCPAWVVFWEGTRDLEQGKGWVGCRGQLCQEGVWERGLSHQGRASRCPWLGNWASPVPRSHLSLCSVIRLPSETGAPFPGEDHVLKHKAEKQIAIPKPCSDALWEY